MDATLTPKITHALTPPAPPRESKPFSPASLQRFALVPTDWGYCGVLWRENNGHHGHASPFASPAFDALLTRIITPGLSEPQLRHTLAAKTPAHEVLPGREGRFHPEIVPTWFGELTHYLHTYFSSSLCNPQNTHGGPFTEVWTHWQPRLDVAQLTPFQYRVLSAIAKIPAGEVLTYGQVARSIGAPAAARAVGAALGANPWPVLIPCHRVVGSNGALTGFSAPGGVTAKKRMLDREKNLLF